MSFFAFYMEISQRIGKYRVSLRDDGVCTIERTYFKNILDYAYYKICGGKKAIRVADNRIDLEKTTMEIDNKKKRIEISGQVNNFLVGFLDFA